jgi:Amt family ammonium transporter
MQVPYQIADSVAGLLWSFVVTFIILFCMNKIPGLSLRAEISVERTGLDQGELGLSCYEYVEEVRANGSIQDLDSKSNGNGQSIGMDNRLANPTMS